MFPTGVLNVLSGLLALEVDSILVDFDNVDVNINDNLVIEGLINDQRGKLRQVQNNRRTHSRNGLNRESRYPSPRSFQQ
jgi:hypothetical protein